MKKNERYYLRRAIKRFKILVIYFCVSRPQYEKAYTRNGAFSIEELLNQEGFLEDWKNKTILQKKRLFNQYKQYSKTSNYTFGIPRELVHEIIGKYKEQRIPVDKVVGELVRRGWLKVTDHGSKIVKDKSGGWKKVYSFKTKYKIANKKLWFKLLSDPRWKDYTKFPRDANGFVDQAVRIIAKWAKSWRTPSNQQVQQQPQQQQPMEQPMIEQTEEQNIEPTPILQQYNELPSEVVAKLKKTISEFVHGVSDYGCLERIFDELRIGKELREYIGQKAVQIKYKKLK